jgi:hypothetical protein
MADGEIAALVERIGIKGADAAFIARAGELAAITKTQTARLPTFGKDVEPAHVLTVPLR